MNFRTPKPSIQIGLIAGSILWLLCIRAGYCSNQIPAPPQDHPIALVGGTIHTVSGPILKEGVLLFSGGLIKEIGTEEDIVFSSDTEKVDIAGKHLYPGMIDANTVMGLIEVPTIRGSVDTTEVGAINPNVRTKVSVNPDSEIIPVTRSNGILITLVAPRGSLIAGQSAAIMLDGWTWEEMTLKSPVGLHLYWPSMKTIETEGREEDDIKKEKKNRKKRLKQIPDAFEEAQAYKQAKEAESESGVPHHAKDVRWESMIPVLEGKLPVFIHADESKQIKAAIAFAKDQGIKMALVGGRDAWRVTDLLVENNIPVIVSQTHALPMRRWEQFDVPFKLPLRLYGAGVKFCISHGGHAHVRNLPYEAATAAAFGLPKDEALKSVTLYPADIMGVGDRVGSLEVGKDATLMITDGDPLEIATQVERAYIQGRNIDLGDRHKALYSKYLKKYRLEEEHE